MYNLAASIGGDRERLRCLKHNKEDRGYLIEVAQEKMEVLEEHLSRQGVR